MKDPYVEEVRKYRLEHTRQFNYDSRLPESRSVPR